MTDSHKIVHAPSVQIDRPEMHPMVKMAMGSNSIDTQTMRELMELQREWESAEAQKCFTRAMVEMKSSLPAVINRDRTVSFKNTKYSFTSIASAMDVIQPHLSEHGFTVSWVPSVDGGKVSVKCDLLHIGGHCLSTTMSAAADQSGSKNSIQAIGSTVTYLERYTLLAILGITTRDMDDVDQVISDEQVDARQNLKAVSYLTSKGIPLEEAEVYLGRSHRQWTRKDLSDLRTFVTNRDTEQPPSEDEQPNDGGGA